MQGLMFHPRAKDVMTECLISSVIWSWQYWNINKYIFKLVWSYDWMFDLASAMFHLRTQYYVSTGLILGHNVWSCQCHMLHLRAKDVMTDCLILSVFWSWQYWNINKYIFYLVWSYDWMFDLASAMFHLRTQYYVSTVWSYDWMFDLASANVSS